MPPAVPGPTSAAPEVRRQVVVGLAVSLLGVAAALLGHRLVPEVGVLTWSVLLGVVVANLGVIRVPAAAALRRVTQPLLRTGIVLLGLSLSLRAVASLGVPVVALVVVVLVTTLLVALVLGRQWGLGRRRSLLLAAGTAICGASAIAATRDPAGADDEDVAAAVAMVTLLGTVAMVALPLLQLPLGLTDAQLGVWAGASIHEVGQVVGAAGAVSGTALGLAVVVKLTRVLLLAPVIAVVGAIGRRGGPSGASRPPVVPLFVIGFLACVLIRSTDVLSPDVLAVAEHIQVGALGAALFAMGAGVRLRALLRGSGPLLAVAAASTVVVSGLGLAGVLLLV